MDASYTNNVLTITFAIGDTVTIDFSDMASASTLSTLSDNFNTLSGEFETVKSTANTTSAAVATIINQLKNIAAEEEAVKKYVDNKMSTHETAREAIDSGFNTRIGAVEEALGGSYDKTNTVAKAIQLAVDAAAAAQADIDAWNSLTEDTNGVIETITELNTYITEHTDAFTGLSTRVGTVESNVETIGEQIVTINTTIEENELVIADALNDLNSRIDSLTSGTISSVTGTDYITATTTDGAVVIDATTGSVADGTNAIAIASDVKAYVDSCWE